MVVSAKEKDYCSITVCFGWVVRGPFQDVTFDLTMRQVVQANIVATVQALKGNKLRNKPVVLGLRRRESESNRKRGRNSDPKKM